MSFAQARLRSRASCRARDVARAGVVAFVLLGANASVAQTPGESRFYEGKQVRLIIAQAPGSPYDIFARIVAKHMPSHIPGKPVFIPQNLLGGIGVTAMNTLYNGVARDGTVIGQATKSVALEPLYRNELAKFDPLNLAWIGAGQKDVSLCFTRLSSPVKTLEDARAHEALVGATGPGGDSNFIAKVVNAFLGTKLKPVLGYPDTPNVAIAMDRGELDGGCGYTSSTLRSTRPEWFDQKQLNIYLQASLKRTKDVPAFGDFVSDPESLEAISVAVSTDSLVRAFVAPPGVPPERMTLLRRAFDETMRDPAFIEDARRAQFDLNPTSGEDLDGIVRAVYATPQPALDRIVAIHNSN